MFTVVPPIASALENSNSEVGHTSRQWVKPKRSASAPSIPRRPRLAVGQSKRPADAAGRDAPPSACHMITSPTGSRRQGQEDDQRRGSGPANLMSHREVAEMPGDHFKNTAVPVEPQPRRRDGQVRRGLYPKRWLRRPACGRVAAIIPCREGRTMGSDRPFQGVQRQAARPITSWSVYLRSTTLA